MWPPENFRNKMELLLVSSPEDFVDEHSMVEALFEQGLSRFHLRKPRHSAAMLERWILGLNSDFHSRIVVHGHPEIARSFNVLGFHMNAKWFETHPMSESFSRSASAHHLREVEMLPEDLSYVWLSPIFDSISKPDYASAFSLESLTEWLLDYKVRKKNPVYALGGIDADNLEAVARAGFDGAVVLGSVWNYPNPVNAWKKMISERDLLDL